MKKISLVLALLLMITLGTYPQKIQKLFDRKICTYYDSTMELPDGVGGFLLYAVDCIEISWRSGHPYSIDVLREDIKFRFEVKYKTTGKGFYIYEGHNIDNGKEVVVMTKKKLSDYLNGKGLTSIERSTGIVIIYQNNNFVMQVYPLLSEKKSESAVKHSGVINDPDGYVNIRREANGQSAVIGKIHDGEVFTYWSNNDNWYMVSTGSGIVGYVHKSRIKEYKNDVK